MSWSSQGVGRGDPSGSYNPIDDLALIGPSSSRSLTVVVVAFLVAAGGTAGLYFGLRGAPRRRVPALVGFSLDQARALAEQRGLGLIVAGSRSDALVAEGSVATQDPLARRRLAEGRAIVVELSSGPPRARSSSAPPAAPSAPAAPGPSPPSAAPVPARAVPAPSAPAPSAPAPSAPAPSAPAPSAPAAVPRPVLGAPSAGGGAVVTVPALTKTSLFHARARLQRAGLELGAVRYKVDEDHMDKMVLGQQPKAGTSVARGSKVDIVVNRYE